MCKNRVIYGFLCTLWVPITMHPRRKVHLDHASSKLVPGTWYPVWWSFTVNVIAPSYHRAAALGDSAYLVSMLPTRSPSRSGKPASQPGQTRKGPPASKLPSPSPDDGRVGIIRVEGS